MAIDRQESPYRRGNRYDRLPIPMVTEHCIAVDGGAVQLVVESPDVDERDHRGCRPRWRRSRDGLRRLRRHAPRLRYGRRSRAPALRLLRERAALPLHRAGERREHRGPHRRAGRRRSRRVLARLRRAPPPRHAPSLRCRRPGRRGRRPARPGQRGDRRGPRAHRGRPATRSRRLRRCDSASM